MQIETLGCINHVNMNVNFFNMHLCPSQWLNSATRWQYYFGIFIEEKHAPEVTSNFSSRVCLFQHDIKF